MAKRKMVRLADSVRQAIAQNYKIQTGAWGFCAYRLVVREDPIDAVYEDHCVCPQGACVAVYPTLASSIAKKISEKSDMCFVLEAAVTSKLLRWPLSRAIGFQEGFDDVEARDDYLGNEKLRRQHRIGYRAGRRYREILMRAGLLYYYGAK